VPSDARPAKTMVTFIQNVQFFKRGFVQTNYARISPTLRFALSLLLEFTGHVLGHFFVGYATRHGTPLFDHDLHIGEPFSNVLQFLSRL
jgi:hypothetical protein